MFNKTNWIECLDEGINEFLELGDYDTAESLKRVKAKSEKLGWRILFTTCAYIGYGYAVVEELTIKLIAKFR